MTFCRRCWTQYTEKTLPAKCPHIVGPWTIVGGVPVAVELCTCDVCKGIVARPRQG